MEDYVLEAIIAMGIRGGIVLGFSIMLFIQWFKSSKRSIKDFKFLFGLQFFFLACAKVFDIYFAVKAGSVEMVVVAENLPILKLRWVLMVANIIPVFSMLVFVWLYKSIKKQILFNAIFILSSFLLVIFAPSYVFLQILLVVMLLPLVILSIITFFNLYRHRRLPQFNSLLMAISQIAYLLMQIVRPILTSTALAHELNYFISECIEIVIWIFMGMAFIIRPRFTRVQTQKVVV
jgi:hypothetical protein